MALCLECKSKTNRKNDYQKKIVRTKRFRVLGGGSEVMF